MQESINYSWKLRCAVGLVMLILAFVGMMITDIAKEGSWRYWRDISLVFALLSLSLSIYLRKMGWKTAIFTFWHELFHWIGLLLTMATLNYFISIGVIGRFEGGLVALTLLAFATYLVGVYIEPTFIPVGIVLGIFAAGSGLFVGYIYSVILPLTILAAIAVVFIIHHIRKAHRQDDSNINDSNIPK